MSTTTSKIHLNKTQQVSEVETKSSIMIANDVCISYVPEAILLKSARFCYPCFILGLLKMIQFDSKMLPFPLARETCDSEFGRFCNPFKCI